MRTRDLGCIAALAAFSLSARVATAHCQLQQIGTLPVDMQGLRAVVVTKINGLKARFILDSGAFYSVISHDAAVQYHLPIAPPPGGFFITGVGGREATQIATAESFDFLGVPLKARFLAVDQNFDSGTIGLIGENLLHIGDTEYDLANGIVRVIKPVGCEGQPLAYWATSTPFSSVELDYMDIVRSNLEATATINGHSIRVMFDTGSPRSFISLQAAARVGITPNSPGVKFVGMAYGIGPVPFKAWIAPDVTFQIGGEKVEHAHLLMGSLRPDRPVGYIGDSYWDMLLGEDFFLSHRIYVAYGQRKLYFTYNGGPLFNLNLPQVIAGAAAKAPAAPAGSQGTSLTGRQLSSDAPTDADGFRRRGMAYASMQEFDRALVDLTHACELAPHDAQNHYDRGLVYVRESQFKPALEDFDAAISIQPNDIGGLLARAQLLQAYHPDISAAVAAAESKSDLDKVSSLAPPGADVRLIVGDLYGKLGDYSAAVDQIDQWLDTHPLPVDQVTGLNHRCWLRASTNRDLGAALDDCDRALRVRQYEPESLGSQITRPLAPDNPLVLDNRGLVYLRLGKPKDAIGDYDSALRTDPNLSSSLYGRGLAELRLGEKTQGQSDLAAAKKLDKGVAQRFAKMGLTP